MPHVIELCSGGTFFGLAFGPEDLELAKQHARDHARFLNLDLIQIVGEGDRVVWWGTSVREGRRSEKRHTT